MISLLAAGDSSGNFVDVHVHPWQWLVLLGLIVALLLIDLLVFHREAHEVNTKEAAIESAAWISIGVAFSLVVLWWYGGSATGEYISGYLIEKSLSVDNVFVWALIMTYFKVPQKYQHRVLFWGIFGALVMRAIFIFAGVELIERFDWVLYVFGGFLIFTAARMLVRGDEEFDPGESKFMKFVDRVVPSTNRLDGPHLFTRINGRRLATPLFAVLMLVEFTDVIFAVDSVPAVLGVSHEEFIVFSSNAFAILGLRALYFLLADLHARFRFLQTGLAAILAFVGVKMVVQQGFDFHIETYISLPIIGIILAVAIIASLLYPGEEEQAEALARSETEAEERLEDADAVDAERAIDPRVTGDHAPRG
jgi:tellurite resistance protein TerC